MRESSELKFNPVKFALCGTNGVVGSKGDNENFFRSALSQNIAYSVWKEAKTVNEIADDLGVSPVYVENEAEYLEEYGFLIKKGDKYLCNILIDEMTAEISRLQDEMYEKAAKLLADDLYDALNGSDIFEHQMLFGGITEEFTYHSKPIKRDKNFFMWALVPYILAVSGKELADKSVSFEEVATVRPDGGHNICFACVNSSDSAPTKYFNNIAELYGPYLSAEDGYSLWQIDSEWTGKRFDDDRHMQALRSLRLIRLLDSGGDLSDEEIAFLHERGLMKTVFEFPDKYHSCSKAVPLCVWIEGKELKNALIAIGDKIKERHFDELQAIQKPYIDAVLKETPKHLYKMQKYGLQWLFFLDGKFCFYCLNELVNSGRLKPPTEYEKKSLSMMIIHE